MVEDKAQARRRPFGAGGWGARHDVPVAQGRSLWVRPTSWRRRTRRRRPLGEAEGRFGFFLLQTAVTH